MAQFQKEKIHLIFGASSDKPVSEMLSVLLPRLASLTVCQSKRKGALEQDEILRVVASLAPKLETFTSESVSEALLAGTRRAAKGDVVLVAGSLFVVGVPAPCCFALSPDGCQNTARLGGLNPFCDKIAILPCPRVKIMAKIFGCDTYLSPPKKNLSCP